MPVPSSDQASDFNLEFGLYIKHDNFPLNTFRYNSLLS